MLCITPHLHHILPIIIIIAFNNESSLQMELYMSSFLQKYSRLVTLGQWRSLTRPNLTSPLGEWDMYICFSLKGKKSQVSDKLLEQWICIFTSLED